MVVDSNSAPARLKVQRVLRLQEGRHPLPAQARQVTLSTRCQGTMRRGSALGA